MAAMWMLGIEPTSSERATYALNCCAISPALTQKFLDCAFCCAVAVFFLLGYGLELTVPRFSLT